MANWVIRRKDGLYFRFADDMASQDDERSWGPIASAALFGDDDKDDAADGADEALPGSEQQWVEVDASGRPMAPLVPLPPAPATLDQIISERITEMLRQVDNVDPELTIRVSCNGFSKLLAEVSNLRAERDELFDENKRLLEQKSLNDETALLAGLGPDERRVLAVLAKRLRIGAETYGELDLARDGRDWEKERGEEVADLLVYSAFAELKRLAREGKA